MTIHCTYYLKYMFNVCHIVHVGVYSPLCFNAHSFAIDG